MSWLGIGGFVVLTLLVAYFQRHSLRDDFKYRRSALELEAEQDRSQGDTANVD